MRFLSTQVLVVFAEYMRHVCVGFPFLASSSEAPQSVGCSMGGALLLDTDGGLSEAGRSVTACGNRRDTVSYWCLLTDASEGQVLWLKKHPHCPAMLSLPKGGCRLSGSLTAAVCLLWKLVPSVTNIPWKSVVKRTVDIPGQAGAPLGVEASLEGMEQSNDLVECGCSLKERGSVDRGG